MIDQKTAQQLKEKGVDPGIILDLMLDQEAAPEQTPEQKPAEQKPAEQKPAEQKPAEQKPEQKPETDPILAAINKLTGAIQASNILKSGSKGPEQETSQDILAQLINPKEGGK